MVKKGRERDDRAGPRAHVGAAAGRHAAELPRGLLRARDRDRGCLSFF